MTRIHTIEMDVIGLVGKHCPDCPNVNIPDGAEGRFDMYLCKAADDKHALAVITTPTCTKHALVNVDMGPPSDPGGRSS